MKIAGRLDVAFITPLFLRFLRLGYSCCLVIFIVLHRSLHRNGPFFARKK
jgi:hypothetical protein